MFRFAASRRWVPWHVFCAAVVVFMLFAGAWQWEVAFSEISADGTPGFNARNLVYAFQWWIFAAFGIWFWFRFLRDQRDAELHELEAAALAAPEQAHDMSVPAQPATNEQEPELISLDDSTERRRARATESLAADAVSNAELATPVEANQETGAEGTRS